MKAPIHPASLLYYNTEVNNLCLWFILLALEIKMSKLCDCVDDNLQLNCQQAVKAFSNMV